MRHRSCLYLPGSKPRVLEKAKTLAADALIFDLEDSVLPEAKDEARGAVDAALKAGGYGDRTLMVRVNGTETTWHQDELAWLSASPAHGMLVPKVESAEQVLALDANLDQAGAPKDFALWVMIETPGVVFELGQIAKVASKTRLEALVLGTNDLAKGLNARNTPDRLAFLTTLSLTVAAARTANLLAIDTVYNDFHDDAGFREECAQGRTLGFDGKTLIHPSQIAGANEVFSPSPEELAEAHAIIAAFDDPANAGKGVLTVGGKMVERLHLDQARRLVE
ncbi:MAG: CoA ester lyase [Pseudomonadota bacterium]